MSLTNLNIKSILLKIPQILKATVIAILVNYGLIYSFWFLYSNWQLNPLMSVEEFRNLSNGIGAFSALTAFLLTARKIIPTPTQAAVQKEMEPFTKDFNERLEGFELDLSGLSDRTTELGVAFALRPSQPKSDTESNSSEPTNQPYVPGQTEPDQPTPNTNVGKIGTFSISTKLGREAGKRQERRKARRLLSKNTSHHLRLMKTAETGELPIPVPQTSQLPPKDLPTSTKTPTPKTSSTRNSPQSQPDVLNTLVNALQNQNDPDVKDLKLHWNEEMTTPQLTEWSKKNRIVKMLLENPTIQKQIVGLRRRNLNQIESVPTTEQLPTEEYLNPEETETEEAVESAEEE
jgi:hypothetical protein